jgi:hypothetical protein
MRNIPSRTNLAKYNVNRPGWEAVRQSLYDFTSYAAAGQTTLNFFATPNGQGGKTLSDTNMTLAGQLPAAQEFLVNSIEVLFFPTVPVVAADNPAAFGVAAIANAVNDVYKVMRTGNLVLTIGSKPYLTEAPLGRFPAKTHFQVDGAVSQGGVVADTAQRVVYSYAAGRPYLLSPADLRLTSSQNFSITLNWPEGLQTITNPGRIGVILDGILYRRSQ